MVLENLHYDQLQNFELGQFLQGLDLRPREVDLHSSLVQGTPTMERGRYEPVRPLALVTWVELKGPRDSIAAF